MILEFVFFEGKRNHNKTRAHEEFHVNYPKDVGENAFPVGSVNVYEMAGKRLESTNLPHGGHLK